MRWRRRRGINPVAGIFMILVLLGAIAFLGMKLLKNDKPGGIKETVQNTPAATQTPAEPTTSPTPSPTPEPTPTPIPPTASIPVKGLYLTPNSVAGKLDKYIELANTTEINSFVIDIKDDLGKICYETQVPLAVKHGAWEKRYDVKEVIRLLHENNIKVIGRIVTFNDPEMPLKEPDMSLKKNDGSVFKVNVNNYHLAWLDPSKKDAWQYIADISKEAAALGFDELQYDYIRFPETTTYKYKMDYLEKEKSEYIREFMQFIREQVPGITLSADIFGNVCIQSADGGGIGQTLETISEVFDYISPMIYPSHFANDHPTHYSGNGKGTNINGVLYPKPDLEPYKVLYNTLLIAKRRLDNSGSNVKVRPYLQGFTADYMPEGYFIEYGANQYRDQIKAVYDAGYEEWIFWNSRNTYVREAFLPE